MAAKMIVALVLMEPRGLDMTRKYCKIVALGLILALTCSAAVKPAAAQEPQAEAAKQNIVVHLSHFTDDLHRCFMALKTANMLQGERATVTLYLDLEGVRLAERRQDLNMTWGSGAQTLAEIYEQFTEKGGRARLCPHCAEGARIGPMAARRHAQIATEDQLKEMWLAADKVITY